MFFSAAQKLLFLSISEIVKIRFGIVQMFFSAAQKLLFLSISEIVKIRFGIVQMFLSAARKFSATGICLAWNSSLIMAA